MASSSSREHRPPKLVRHNSSFLGTIKNLVTAPLTWFGNQDDELTSGKRRRPLQQAPTVTMLSTDEETRQPKRMRLHSPPQPPRRTSVIPRASSAVLPSRVHRSTLSPMRNLSISRTMSIDPPTRENSFNFVSDMDISMDTIRDPLSAKPSFRMRSSLTPQPQLSSRHISEPPSLNALISSHPVFLRPPSVPHDSSPAPTLGSLVETVRSTTSPLRQQHASLLFVSDQNLANNENDDGAPAERALHQLDVYKTPLLPTRMRSSNLPASITATTTPDMFKSRRPSHLILMQDDKDQLARRTGKSPVVNETKPYAGEGGMKKLLARRKLEEDFKNENDQRNKVDHKDKDGQKDQADHMAKEAHSKDSNTSHHNLPPLPAASLSGDKSGTNWFAGASTSGSSLRVGRVKTSRNHIQRPSRAKFSAIYEDDGDDNMEDDNRRSEREELEEAARRAPVFTIPKGFSFANDTSAPLIKSIDLENAKEPPIVALPFSFAKSSTAPAPLPPQHSFFGTTKTDDTPKLPTLMSNQGSAPSELIPDSKPTPAPFILLASTPLPNSNGGIPNFFASSQLLAKTAPAAPALPLVLNFTASFPSTEPVPSVPTQPVKDAENPFWDGEEPKRSEDKSPQNILPALEKTATGTPTSSSGSAFAPPLLPSTSVTSATPLPFSFNKPSETKPEASNFGSTATVELKQSFSVPASSNPVSLDGAEVKSSSGENASTSRFLSELPMLLGKPVNSTSAFGQVVPSQSPMPFNFGSQSPSKTEPESTFTDSDGTPDVASTCSSTTGVPKPSFGVISGGKAFSFGEAPAKSTEQNAIKPAPFLFSTTSPAPVVEPQPVTEPPPIFSFGQSSSTAAATATSPPITFSFSGGGSTSADVSTRQPFLFGQHNAVVPTERPVTPPRNPDTEFRMEESPTREMQQNNGTNRPTLTLGSGFSFNASPSTGTSLFGGGSQNTTSPLSTTSPFSFGGSSPSNPFAPKDKSDEPKAFGGFGQTNAAPSSSSNPFAPKDKPDELRPFETFGKTGAVSSTSTGFSFGQSTKASEETQQRPSTTGSFSFNTTPTSATASSPFSFGTSQQNVNPFGQATSGSAPSSPSTFNQPSPFAFGLPAPSTNAPFGFGSQPTSPAGGTNLTLPQPASSGGFAFGQPAQQPSSPFAGPIPLAPSTSSGGSLFTIGAGPASAPAAGGPRQIRKLPNRRGIVKR